MVTFELDTRDVPQHARHLYNNFRLQVDSPHEVTLEEWTNYLKAFLMASFGWDGEQLDAIHYDYEWKEKEAAYGERSSLD